MRWIIEKDVFEEETLSALMEQLRTEDVPFNLVSVNPFTHEMEGRGLQSISAGERVFVRGAFGIAEACVLRGWKPVVWTGAELDEARVSAALGTRYLNADGVVHRFGDLRGATLPHDAVFIKPAGDTKEFAGQIVKREAFDDWRADMLASGYIPAGSADLPVFVAEPKRIGCEWRVFVVGGAIASACCYRQYQRVMPERWVPDPVMAFAQDCVAAYDPLPGYVLDITQVEDGTYRVLELNTLNHAGLYACDPALIATAVNAELGKEADHAPRSLL